MKTSRAPNRVSLPRALSKLGYASRTQAFVFIEEGRVAVNGKTERNPHRWVNIESDKISVDAGTVSQKEFRYLLFHKPAGVTTTRSDERGHTTVFDIVGEGAQGLSSVGRLDKDTSGLVLLTNDHQLANRLTDPNTGIPKTYSVLLDKPLRGADAAAFERGVTIQIDGADYRTKQAKLRVLQGTTVEVTITEGKNRQIRKMFEALGYSVLELQRLSIGPLSLGTLKEKVARPLTAAEIKALQSASLQ